MKKVLISICLAAFAALFFTACLKETEELNGTNVYKQVDMGALGSGSSCTPLIAGQSTNAGDVCITDSDTNGDGNPDQLIVTYSAQNGWMLKEIHFWIGSTLASMPQTNNGSPKLGQFPYKASLLNTATYTITIPFSTIGYSCPDAAKFYFVAHAVVSKAGQTETAYGGGERLLARGNWSMFNTIWITCDVVTETPTSSETAWARMDGANLCFSEIEALGANRWGWANGPFAPGTYVMDLYAAAGQCNLSAGTLVGTVTVVYNGSSVSVSAVTAGVNQETLEPYKLDEVHIYAGNEMLPLGNNGEVTVAPGQLGYNSGNIAGATSHNATINNLSGNIYVLLHAVVSGFPLEN
jgi:hypothetical protein